MATRLIKEEEVIIVPNYGIVNLYRTLKPTKYSLYIPFLSIMVEDYILDAVIIYLQHDRYAGLGLEEYLNFITD